MIEAEKIFSLKKIGAIDQKEMTEMVRELFGYDPEEVKHD
jgi:hypothetical protein